MTSSIMCFRKINQNTHYRVCHSSNLTIQVFYTTLPFCKLLPSEYSHIIYIYVYTSIKAYNTVNVKACTFVLKKIKRTCNICHRWSFYNKKYDMYVIVVMHFFCCRCIRVKLVVTYNICSCISMHLCSHYVLIANA